ncbi:annexin [Myxococcus sp. K15C18031901]|nr:annexin [Myxococcus dinghuensis]
MKGGLTGWGTDEDAIFKTLDKKSPADIALIRQSFKEHYKLDLDATLRDELGGDDLTRVNGILAGNKGNAGAAAIQQQTGWFGDKDAMLNTLRQAPPAERQAIARSFQQMYGKDHPGIQAATPEEFMQKALGSSLDAAQRSQLANLLATTRATSPGDVTRLEADAARSKVHDALQGFFGADSKKVFDTLEGLPAEQKKLLLADASLQTELRGKLSKEDYARARGILEGNPAASNAAKIDSATRGWFGTDKSAVLDVLKNTKPEDLPALKAEFQKQTGRSLESEVRGWGGADTQVGLRYLNPPAADDKRGQAEAAAEQLHRAMDGIGTDEAALREVLGNKSKAQIDDITAAYRDLYKRDLRSDLTSELGGRDKFEIVDQMYDLGAIDPKAPDAARQQADRLRAQQRFEQSNGLGFIDTIQHLTKGESDSERLERNLSAAETAIATGDTDAANRRLGYSTDDVKDLQETKDSTADMAATAAVAVVTTAAVVATGGAATPLAIAGYAALGATTRVATQAYFKGDALGLDGVAQQAVVGAIEGGTAVIPLPKVLGGASTTAAAEVSEQVVKQTLAQRVRTTAIQGAWEGGVGGALGGAADQSMQSETWKNGVLPGLAQVGQRALVDGTVGSVFGAGGGVVMDGAMAGVSHLARPKEIPVSVNPQLEGRTVHVRYGEGRVRIEAGPEATAADIAAHMETARTLQKYEGPLGQARQLRDAVMQELTQRPGYGTQGFESQLEVKKLKSLIQELESVQQRIDTRLGQLGETDVASVAQREAIEKEIAGLRSQLDVHAGQVDSLDSARGYVAAEQSSKGRLEAEARGYPTDPKDLPANHHWVQNEYGELFLRNDGPGTRMQYVPPKDGVAGKFEPVPDYEPPKKISPNATRADAFRELGGTDANKPLGQWLDVMKREGVLTRDQEFIDALPASPGGRSADTIRHEAKVGFTEKLVDKLVRLDTSEGQQALAAARKLKKPDGTPFTEAEARLAASQQEMLRVTSRLSNSDKGAIANRWYEQTFLASRAGRREVRLSQQEAQALGVTLNKDRRIDVVEGHGATVRELKNVATGFGESEKLQILDDIKLYDRYLPADKVTPSVPGVGPATPQKVDRVNLTMLDPKGVVANKDFIREQLADPRKQAFFEVEVYRPDGTSVVIGPDDVKARAEFIEKLSGSKADLEKYLGLDKTP